MAGSQFTALVGRYLRTKSNTFLAQGQCAAQNKHSQLLGYNPLSRSRHGLNTSYSALLLPNTAHDKKCFGDQYNRLMHSGGKSDDFVFRQLLDYRSFTFTYLLADKASRQAILIDPVIETVERDIRLVKDFGFDLVFGVNTHVHADHITGTGVLKKYIPNCRSVIAEASQAKADVKVKQGDKIPFGKFELEALSTPGHTDGCMSYVCHEREMVFTGDAVLIRGCGRTDFQQGDASRLYDSVHSRIFTLPHNFRIFPAHDYTGQSESTVGEEIQFNPRLSKPRSEFIEIMQKLKLPYPKQIDKAVPANMVCGIFSDN